MTGTLGNCRPTHVGTQMLPFPAVNHHKEDLQLCYKSESSRWKPATTDHDARGGFLLHVGFSAPSLHTLGMSGLSGC